MQEFCAASTNGTPVVLLAREHLLDRLARVTLRSFERSAKGTIPDQLGSDTKGTGDTEQDSIELHLVQATTREGVNQLCFLTTA